MSRRTLNLVRHVPPTKKLFFDPEKQVKVHWHHRFKKEDYRTLDKRNRENADFICKLIETQRRETTQYVCKWTTIIGKRVLELAMMGPDVTDARAELEDILFLRLHKHRQYHIDYLYKDLVPQLEFVKGDLIRTFPFKYNDNYKLTAVIEFANNGLPPLPVPEECYLASRNLTYPELLPQLHSDLPTAIEMLHLLPTAKRVHTQREINTKLDFEGSTLQWQADCIQKEVDTFKARLQAQEERNDRVTRGEQIRLYKPLIPHGYRIPGSKRNTPLTADDYNNGYR